MDAAKLIQYTHRARRRYLKALGELPWDEVVIDRGASFLSMKDIFLHALGIEDMFINYVIPGKPEKWIPYDFSKFLNMQSIERLEDDVEKKTDEYLVKLTEKELNRKVMLPWRKDIQFRIEDILLQIAFEDASHLGELIALMWQFDKQPPYLNWAAFLIEQGT